MEDAGVRWSELPPELWSLVGKYLHSHIDAVRFRSVCRSWRSSVPAVPQTCPPLGLRFPLTSRPAYLLGSTVDAFLSERTVYRHEQNPNWKGCLVKLERSEMGEMRYLHPLSNRIIHSSKSAPREGKDWNLLDVRVHEVARSYSLKLYDRVCVPGIAKLVVFPDPGEADDEAVPDCVAIAVWDKGKLGFARSGDEEWSVIDEQNFHYDDVIVYNRRVYAVNRWGAVFWIDSSMSLVRLFGPPLIGGGQRKHLVECGGELLLVDRFVEEAVPVRNPIGWPYNWTPKAVGFKAYRADRERGRWVEVRSLGNRSIVLGNACCFSVDAWDFEGCQGNCIYFCDSNDNEVSERGSSRLFDLQGGTIANILPHRLLFDKIFFPPPFISPN